MPQKQRPFVTFFFPNLYLLPTPLVDSDQVITLPTSQHATQLQLLLGLDQLGVLP